MHDSTPHWNGLHSNPRFRPVYPNEHVIRFLIASRGVFGTDQPVRLLDIGTGAGRHMKLAAELGFLAFGTDISHVGLVYARERLASVNAPNALALCPMTSLPFADGSFRIVLSYGVFYYGSADDMKRAISEVHRVLAPGGKAFVVVRTTDDYRFGKGRELGPNTFQLDIADTNELGTIQHFVAADDVPHYFATFSQVSFEKTDTTFAACTRVNSDWLITAEK